MVISNTLSIIIIIIICTRLSVGELRNVVDTSFEVIYDRTLRKHTQDEVSLLIQ